MKYYFANTPHSTYRVFATFDVTNYPNVTHILDFLSCWGGVDKKTSPNNLRSWEFDEKLPKKFVRKALSSFEEVEVLEW